MMISAIAEEKVKLQLKLINNQVRNTYGKTIDELTAIELESIEAMKRLFEVEREIKAYIEGADITNSAK